MEIFWRNGQKSRNHLEIEIFEYNFTTLTWKSLGSTPYEPSVEIPNVSHGRHNYKVRAKLNGQYSDFSNIDMGFILKAPGAKPIVSLNKLTPPSFKGETAATIKWPAVNDPFTTHIGIYRKTLNGDYKMIAMPDKSKTSYKDTSVQPNAKYIYLILNMRKDGDKIPDFSPSTKQDGSILTYPAPVQNFTAAGKGDERCSFVEQTKKLRRYKSLQRGQCIQVVTHKNRSAILW